MNVQQVIDNYVRTRSFDPRFKSGMTHALSGGKHLRARLTDDLLSQLLPECSKLCDLILIPEFIHTASLIIDDLPAFDNSPVRRGKEATHVRFGEGMAYLLSFTLLTESLQIINNYSGILKTIHGDWLQRAEILQSELLQNISPHRAIGGQLLSTFHTSGMNNLNTITNIEKMPRTDIIHILSCKTTPFFEIALLTGWICGGGSLDKLGVLRELANAIGIGYQIHDDIEDYDQDTSSGHFSHNYVYHCGMDVAKQELCTQIDIITRCMTTMNISGPTFDQIVEILRA